MLGNKKIWYGLGLDNKSLKTDAEQSKNILKGISNKAVEEGKKIDTSYKTLARTVGLVFSTGVLASFVKKIATVRGEFQQLEVAFTTMLGSKQKADALMQRTMEFAAKTPFDLQGVANGTKQLLAYGSGAETVTDELNMLGNIASGLSIPLNDIVYLYGTTRTQGRLYTQDLKQFMGRGIPLAEELANQFRVQKDEVQGLVTAGKVGFEHVEKAMRNMTAEGGKFYNLMEEQSKTITGKMSNLGDAMSQMFNKMGKSQEGAIGKSLDITISLVENYEEVGRVIAELIAVYGTYRAALITVNAVQRANQTLMVQQALAGRVLTTTQKAATLATLTWQKAQRALNTTILANPYVAVASAITGLLYVGYKYVTHLTDLEKAQKKVSKNFENADKSIRKEEIALNTLIAKLKTAKKGTKDYHDLKEKLQLNYKDYIGKLEEEKLAINDIESAYDGVIKKIREKYYAQAFSQAMTEANNDYIEEEAKNLEKIRELFIDKYGEKEGIELYYKILPEVSNEKLSEEAQKIVEAFDKEQVALSRAGNSEIYTSNAIKNYLQQIQTAKKIHDLAANEANKRIKEKNQFYKDEEDDDEVVELLKNRTTILKEIEEVEKKIKALRDKTKGTGVSDGLTDKEIKELAEYQRTLSGLKATLESFTGSKWKTSPTRETETDFAKVIQENKVKRERMTKDLEFAAKKAEIEASKEGLEKKLALNELNYKIEVEQLRRMKEDRLIAIQKQEREIWEAQNPDWKKKKLVQKTVTNDLDENEKASFKSLSKNAEVKFETSNKEAYNEELRAYAEFIRAYIDKKREFDENIKQMKQNGFSEDVISKTETAQGEILKGLDEEMQVKEDVIIALAEKLVGLGLNEILEQLAIAREALEAEISSDKTNQQQVVILTAKIKALEKLLADRTKKDTTKSKDKDWRKTISLLYEINDATEDVIDGFNGMSESTKVVMSSVMSITGSTIGMISSISRLANFSNISMKMTAEGASKAIIAVEKASVILAIVSAAIQIAQKVVSIISGSKDKKKEDEIKRLKYQVKTLEAAYDALGRAIDKAYGKDASDLMDKQEENLKRQRALLIEQLRAEQSKKKSSQSRIEELRDRINEITREILAISEKQQEAIIGQDVKSAIDEFADAYMDAWQAGEDKAKAMNNVVKDIIRNAVKQFIGSRMSGEVEAFYSYLATAMEDGVLSVAEKQTLDTLEAAINNKLSELNNTLDEYVIDEEEDTREAEQKGFATMSQDSADELNGRFTVIQSHTYAISEAMITMRDLGEQQLNHLASINTNTARLSAIENDIAMVKSGIEDINTLGIKIR